MFNANRFEAQREIVEAFLGKELAKDCKSFVLRLSGDQPPTIEAEIMIFDGLPAAALPAIQLREWQLTEVTEVSND